MRRWLAAFVRRLLVASALTEAWMRYRFGGIAAVAEMVPGMAKHQVIPLLRRYGAVIGDDCDVCSGLVLHNAERDFSHLLVGNRVHIGPGCLLDLRGEIRIGERATISMRTVILTHTDVGASPVAHLGFPPSTDSVVVGPGAYLGACCTLLMGARIGRNAVVGATSLIRGMIPDSAVAAGSPARIIRSLASPEN